MKIDKELIEKYHLGKCTSEEKLLVEEWLMNDDFEAFPSSEKINKQATGEEIWQNLSTFISSEQKNTRTENKLFLRLSKIAAALVLISSLGFLYIRSNIPQEEIITFDNSQSTEVKHIESDIYSISMGPNSNGKINSKTGLMNFCGSILLSPKVDVELNVQGHPTKVKLKTGQTYIVLSSNCPTTETIVLNEKDMSMLSPIVQKQLIVQFKI